MGAKSSLVAIAMPDSDSIYPMLIIDMASRRPWLGFKREASSLQWIASEVEASKALFESLVELKKQAHFELSEIASVAFNEGPGSMLGIRTAIMAIRTWQSAKIFNDATLFAYDSLTVGLESLGRQPSEKKRIVVTDARRNSWNALSSDQLDSENSSGPRLLRNEELESMDADCYLLKEFPRWTQSQVAFTLLEYRPESFFYRNDIIGSLRETEVAKPFVLREAEYQKWIPRFKPQDTAL